MSGYQPVEIPMTTVDGVADGGGGITTIIQSAPVSTQGPNATVVISGYLEINPGPSATNVDIYFYRGPNSGGAGHQIGLPVYSSVVVGSTTTVPFVFTDSPGDVSGLVYTIAVKEGGGTGPGTVSQASIHGVVY